MEAAVPQVHISEDLSMNNQKRNQNNNQNRNQNNNQNQNQTSNQNQNNR